MHGCGINADKNGEGYCYYGFIGVGFHVGSLLLDLQINWFNDQNVLIDEGVETRQELMADGKRFVTVSVLKFVASTEHHNRTFSCQAQNSAIRQPQSTSIR